jgi:hypothetical protein
MLRGRLSLALIWLRHAQYVEQRALLVAELTEAKAKLDAIEDEDDKADARDEVDALQRCVLRLALALAVRHDSTCFMLHARPGSGPGLGVAFHRRVDELEQQAQDYRKQFDNRYGSISKINQVRLGCMQICFIWGCW